MTYNQESFLGGLSSRFDRLRPDANSYPLLINGRVRDNRVEAIKKLVQDTSLPTGTYQNITAVGSILVVFISGAAFYRDTATTNGWRSVLGLTLDTAADVDTVPIPASTINYKRSGPLDAVSFNNSAAARSPEAILATDGTTQPCILYPVAGGTIAARPTQTYAQWTETPDGTLREYVPVGRFPVYAGRKLYMAIKSSSGYLNRIAQSVSGRPIDFVVAITNATGDKDGDALTTATSAGFDELTGLYATSFNDGSFLACTARNTTGLTPDFSNGSFFGEPYFINTPLFKVGALNNHSAADLNGDSAFITQTGILSYNATQQNKIESNSDPISSQVYKLLAPTQTFGAAVNFNDYAMFSVNTVFGPAVVVYDTSIVNSAGPGRFVAIDMYSGVGQIKQFAKTTAATGERLWFITADNRLFEFGAASSRETCRFYIGDWNTASGKVVQNFRRAQFVFSEVTADTVVQVTNYTDQQLIERVGYPLVPASQNDAPVISVPFAMTTGPATAIVQYEPSSASYGFGIGAMVEWDSSAKLVFCTLEAAANGMTPSQLSQNYTQGTVTAAAPQKFVFVGDFDPGTVPDLLVKLPLNVTVIGLGDYFYGADHTTDYAAYANTLQVLKSQGRFIAVAGNHDLDVDGGLVYNNFFGNGKRHYSIVVGNVEFFIYNTGWNTANVGTTNHPYEPDGFVAGSVQANELRAALAASTAKFKFVVLHEPPYSSVANYTPGYSLLRLPFKAWGATAVFSGHAHLYERVIVDGLNYYTVGTGGHSPSAFAASYVAGHQNGLASTPGYLMLTTDEYDATSKFIRADTGAAVDLFAFGR